MKGGYGGHSNLSQAIKDLQGKMITHLLILPILILFTASAVHLLHGRGRVYWSHPGKNPGDNTSAHRGCFGNAAAVDRLICKLTLSFQSRTIYVVVMVTGGTGATTSAELLHINGTKLCSLPNLPVARYQHSQTGIVFDNFAIYSATFFC